MLFKSSSALIFVTALLATASSAFADNSSSSSSSSDSSSSSSSSSSSTTSQSSSSTTNFNPNSVNSLTKKTWCNNNRGFCKNLCQYFDDKNPQTNTCNSNTLVWDCVCSNGTRPDTSTYTFYIPYYQCVTEVQNCQQDCNKDTFCQQQCATSRNCTAPKDPYNGNTLDEGALSGALSNSATDGGEGGNDGYVDPFGNNDDDTSVAPGLSSPSILTALSGALVVASSALAFSL